MATALPLPPSGVPFIDPATGGVNILWSNYLLALEDVLNLNVAPKDAQYWVSTSNSELDNERNLGALSTGYVKITTTLGIAVPSSTATIPAGDLASGGTFPAINGSNLTALTGANIAGGGTYTPTLTGVANVAASTAYVCQYAREGVSVFVSGKVDIDPTSATTLTQLGISLPVASNFAAAENCGGTAVASAVFGYAAAIAADLTNDRAELAFTTATDVANRSWAFSFQYVVI